ncbi:laminin-like protein epi-1 [Impatiens glandulifera]|uniref:laminin-like protein epi-1 n=1 Tax=Impatiens glandulifera TaxID=253017 RepID=UPI001FB17AEE|nr:laminin-like protein epi-1 [Impatiens glandulifera]
MLVGLIEGTKVNWAKEVFNNLKDMVKPDSTRSWGYAVPLGKIFLHHNLKIGPGVTIPSRSLIRAKQFPERKQPAPGSTGGRKKTTGKKSAPAKEKAERKGKEKIVFSEPPQQTEVEESASTSEQTESEKTDDERPNDEEEHSGQSPDNTSTGADHETEEGGEESSEKEEEEDEPTKADKIARKTLKVIEQRADKVGEIYREWHEHRFSKRYRHILPGYTDEECFQRLREVEDVVMDLTNSETIHEALGRTCLLRPRAQLRKLTIRIRKITLRFEEVISEDTLTPLVLERLEKARGELVKEIERLEVMYKQREIPHYIPPRIEKGQTSEATPPRANPATDETDERTDPPLTEQSPHKQPEVSEPGVTKEWVKSLIQEFEDSTVNPLEEKFKRTVSSALRFANTTRQLLSRTEDRFSEIEDDQQKEAVLRSNHLRRTVILEDTTSEIKENFDRLERETDERLTEVTKDLVGTTLDRVSDLEKKNVGLEDDLKALTAQVAKLLQAKMNADAAAVEADARAAQEVQDTLDNEARKAKDPPQLPEEEEAERVRRTEAKFPGFAKTVAAQAAKDAERLERERQRLKGFAAANKKKKEASASSIPAKRKRKQSKKDLVTGLLNEVTETVIQNQPDPVTHNEDEDEEHLQPRSTRQRVSESASRPQLVKKKRNKNLMASYDFSDSE